MAVDDQLTSMPTEDILRNCRLLDNETRIYKVQNPSPAVHHPVMEFRVIAATNCAYILDPTLLRSRRLDRKIEFPHPSEEARGRILQDQYDLFSIIKTTLFYVHSTDDFNGAELKAVCVEAGILALRQDATEVTHEDFNEGIIQVQAKKKSSLNYYA
ncbi:26S proteasome regulatory subunit 6A homolog [Phragmites australis]|uniref:26S proteasome regulatory subunit 6A homolog n=1 Tax=Phragmites australis TaxID=29695 RepID=UPI002D77D0D9|nr:26S proteasome regulatory subunit 6A homolog [Phragmites australis]